MPRLSRIVIYPVKALPGVDVNYATITARGALVHDREYALMGKDSMFINGKVKPAIHQLDVSCAIVGDDVAVTIRSGADSETFALGDLETHRTNLGALEARLTHFFNEPVHIERDVNGGFPDDPASPGPTVVSETSLASVASWYPELTIHDMSRRFRANLELSECPAFWEDRLYGNPGEAVEFQIGNVRLLGTNPCRRCVVPTRDALTGTELPRFQRTFVEQRKKTLPAWANRAQFDFYYRFATNTRPADGNEGKVIRVGDVVEIL